MGFWQEYAPLQYHIPDCLPLIVILMFEIRKEQWNI